MCTVDALAKCKAKKTSLQKDDIRSQPFTLINEFNSQNIIFKYRVVKCCKAKEEHF